MINGNAKFVIPPGNSVQGDSNSRHQQGDILNVKGFYDQDSHVMPENLIACRGILSDGIEDAWCEYVPESYDGSKPVPLIISRHGGGQSGWGQCYATSWIYVAEQQGFIVVFPTTTMPPRGPEGGRRMVGELEPEAHDVSMIIGLIGQMKIKYNIDATRIYSQGMSMGDIMSTRFARVHGKQLAGIGLAAGPTGPEDLFATDGKLLQNDGAVPCYQARGEHDTLTISAGPDGKLTRYDINKANKEFWIQLNGCNQVPTLRIDGRSNFEYYTGGIADVIVRDVKERGHGQTFDDAQYAWDLCFSRYQRVDGEIVCLDKVDQEMGDSKAVAVADGCSKAYVNNCVTDMTAPAYQIQDTFKYDGPKLPFDPPSYVFTAQVYVPVTLLATAFGGSVEQQDDGKTVWLTLSDGREVQFGSGNAGTSVDGRVVSMWRQAEWKDKTLFIPFQWFATDIMGLYVTENDGAVWASPRYGEMTAYMARTIKEVVLS